MNNDVYIFVYLLLLAITKLFVNILVDIFYLYFFIINNNNNNYSYNNNIKF